MAARALLKFAALGAGLVSLSGCYTVPPQYVAQPGARKSAADFQRDDAACRQQAYASGAATAQTSANQPTPQNQAYIQCMTARGNTALEVPGGYTRPVYYGYYGPYPYGPYWWDPYWGPYYGPGWWGWGVWLGPGPGYWHGGGGRWGGRWGGHWGGHWGGPGRGGPGGAGFRGGGGPGGGPGGPGGRGGGGPGGGPGGPGGRGGGGGFGGGPGGGGGGGRR